MCFLFIKRLQKRQACDKALVFVKSSSKKGDDNNSNNNNNNDNDNNNDSYFHVGDSALGNCGLRN